MTQSRSKCPSRRQVLRVTGATALASLWPIMPAEATTLKTPGVYIQELDAFPNSVIAVESSVPAFVGHTQKAEHNGTRLHNRPRRIRSFAEYIEIFGAGPDYTFDIKTLDGAKTAETEEPSDQLNISVAEKSYRLEPKGPNYLLHRCMKLFFANGGGDCFVVSVGNYEDDPEAGRFEAALAALRKEPVPSIVVLPEAMLLAQAEAEALQRALLAHCVKLGSRVAILDVWQGYRRRAKQGESSTRDPVDAFRAAIRAEDLSYGAAYYPWLETTIVPESELGLANFSNLYELLKLIDGETPDDAERKAVTTALRKNLAAEDSDATAQKRMALDQALRDRSPLYKSALMSIREWLNLLPPSAAMAGLYASVDNARGVWKAPANVSVNAVEGPSVVINGDEQEDLNSPIDGKAVNAIRPFVGEGTLVWGARTLDGHSLDWRYINVRRTAIMIEESIKLAARGYIFEPNDANTWSALKAALDDFLTGLWKQGALPGTNPEAAFDVQVGLGSTMTANDILEGILRVAVRVALVRPAEFIELTFQQQMQKS